MRQRVEHNGKRHGLAILTGLWGLLLLILSLPANARYVDPDTCGGDGQPACYLSSAKYLNKVVIPNPGNGAFLDIGRDEWWRCPAGYSRSLSAVTAADACVKNVGNPGNGAFWDVGRNEWWRCPGGFQRTWSAVDASDACRRENSKPASPSGYGAVFYDVGREEWWACPSGLGRTTVAVTRNDACDRWHARFPPWNSWIEKKPAKLIRKKFDKQRAQFISAGTQKSSATFVSTARNSRPDGVFEDPRLDDLSKGAEYWRCPAGFTRNANPITHDAACSATIGQACDAGNIDVGNPIKGYTCYKKNECGKNGQRPCLIVERVPSCNSNLAEDFVDGICVDNELATCLTMTRAMLVTRDVAGAMSTPTPQLMALQAASDAVLELIGNAINEIVNALPAEIRNNLQFDIDDLVNQGLAELGSSVGQATDSVIASVGLEADTFNKFASAVNTRSDKIADFVSDPNICRLSDKERGTRLEAALGFKPGFDSAQLQKGKLHFMVGLGASLEAVFKGAAAGVDLDVYLAYAPYNGEARVFWAIGPAAGVSTGSSGIDIALTAGFKSAQDWSAFEGWAGSVGIGVDLPVKMRGLNGFTLSGTYLDPFANNDLIFDGAVLASSLTKGDRKIGVSAGVNMQHTWRIQPKIVQRAFTGSLKAAHSQKCLDANGQANSSNVSQWECHGGNNQLIEFKPVAGKTDVYSLVFKDSGKCADVTGASQQNAANIQLWDCVDVPQQQFKLERLPDTTYKVVAQSSNKVLDVISASQANGGNVQQYDYADQSNQQWILIRSF